MAAEWWWFLALNAMVAAIAVLSKVGPPSSSPRGGGITRRASSAVLQRLRSSIFSFPSASFHTEPAPLLQPEATASQETEEPAEEALPTKPAASTPRSLTRTPPPARLPSAKEVEEEDDPNAMSMEEAYALVQAAQRRSESERGKEEDDDPNAMSMEEAYALVQEARRWRPEPEREKEARGSSDVNAKAEEFIQGFKEDLRQQRLNSIFNYTQMLKQRAQGGGRRQPAARPDQL